MSSEKIGVAKDGFFLNVANLGFNNVRTCWFTNFSTGRENVVHWRLTIVRSVYNRPIVYLTLLSINDQRIDKIEAKCHFYITFTSSEYSKSDSKDINTKITFPTLEEVHIYSSNISAVNLFTFAINGMINEVCCHPIPVKIEPAPNHFPISTEIVPSHVLKNYESLLTDEKNCDVTFLTSDTSFPAHKLILAAQSPVFDSMFRSDMPEKNGVITIDMVNVEDAVLREMLRFIYTGRVENLDEMADKLLFFANKYEIKSLMILCEKTLYEKLTTANAISTIKLAYLHNAEKLRRLTQEFIIKNKKDLLETPEFTSLMTSHPKIVIDILNASL